MVISTSPRQFDLQSSSPVRGAARRTLTEEQQRWLADLYQAHFPAVHRLCYGVLRNLEDAADAAHETFLIAAGAMQPEVIPRVARSWLLTVARNHCLDVLRRRKRHGRALVTLGGNPGNGADIESTIVDRDFTSAILSHLSPRERQALWQSAVESRPLADIATGLQLNYMAAAQVLHRARRHAASAAARFAVLIGAARLGRALRRAIDRRDLGGVSPTAFRSLGTADRILALAAVPLIVAAVQTSSSPTSLASDSAQRTTPVTTLAVPASVNLKASPLPSGGALLPGATSPLNTAVDSLRQYLSQQPVPTPSLPVIPSLPPVEATLPPLPVATPSLPPILP